MPARVCGRPHTVASQEAENTDQNQRQINLQDLPLPTPFFPFSPGLPRLHSLHSIPNWGQVFKHRSLWGILNLRKVIVVVMVIRCQIKGKG